jgi:transcriptional regulator
MYLPEAFAETRPDVLFALIRAHPFGLLVSTGPEGPLVSPVPFTLAADEGERGTLRAHVAHANPHWRALAAAPQALALFQGPEAYVTPSWYATKRDTGKVVPTWNYLMVEARGRATAVEDPAWLRAQIEALTTCMETPRPEPWAVADAPERFVASQIRGIVGIELPIAVVAGKRKLSQNRPAADRRGVAEGLARKGDATMAGLVGAADPDA